jgi:hypothetical protein
MCCFARLARDLPRAELSVEGIALLAGLLRG